MTTSLQDIKDKLNAVDSGLTPQARQELTELVDKLSQELETLARTDRELAQSVSGFAGVSAHEATRANGNDETLDYALKGFSSSVEEVEASHPRLVAIVNRICQMLSDIGI